MNTAPVADVSAIGMTITLVMGVLLILVPRRYAFVPIMILCCYMTMGQAIVVAGCHFTMIRVLMLFGWGRLLLRGEGRALRWNQLDTIIMVWSACSFVIYVIMWHDLDAIVYKLGAIYNAVGFYFLFRMLLRTVDDGIRIIKITALTVVPLAGLMLLEKSTGRNLFAIFGGVPEITLVRDGVLRCMGPFAHPILAGTFGSNLVAFFVCIWRRGISNKLLSAVGVSSALIIAISSGSSGPILGAAIAVLGLCIWPLRSHMRQIRWAILLTLLALQLVMKVPVWFLLARIDVFSGSTGYHRAMLIDRAFANLGDWFLIGTKSTAAWANEDQGLFDVTNQYLVVGKEGGLLCMLLFIWIIVRGFRYVGLALRAAQTEGEPFNRQLYIWALGATLLAHTVTYLSVSYFDQNFVTWYLLLAMIATAQESYLRRNARPKTVPSSFHEDLNSLVLVETR